VDTSILVRIIGNNNIPTVPNKFTTAIAIATSSFSLFFVDEANAAIALDPQIAVPNPTNIPVLPGQFIRRERNTVSDNTKKTTKTIPKNAVVPNSPISV
jgi:hypothetical protein